MSQEKQDKITQLLSRALHRMRTTPPRIIASPATQPRRATVAIVIRIVPSSSTPTPPADAPIPTLSQFFELDWVKDPAARPEILFLQRDGASSSDGLTSSLLGEGSTHRTSKVEAQLAFPGGRMEEGDEGGLYTAMRQTWEEIGLDLAERDFTCIGQLDDREITTSLGKRLLMILSPFVFLQLTPRALSTEPAEGTSIHWTPLEMLVCTVLPEKVGLVDSRGKWSTVTVDAASRLTPRHAAVLKFLVRVLIGSMQFPAILLNVPESDLPRSVGSPPLPTSASYPVLTQDVLEKGIISDKAAPAKQKKTFTQRQFKLWGLSLGMTLDLMANMLPEPVHSKQTAGQHPPSLQLPFRPVGGEGMRVDAVAPSLASVFPRFSYPDVNFWIWVFGKRYREVVRGWEASIREGGLNWSGTALNNFYAAVRKALVVVIVLRAIGVLCGLLFAGWWIFA
ncbi:hypothetical protein EV363DRAFT_1413512 [Boletus edulis]|nr:hypothetical protein EV363DRAFT_1413512 [Boletus edulis]